MSTTTPPPHPGYGAQAAYQGPPPPPGGPTQGFPAGQPLPPTKPPRPWFKKKRFIIPILFVLFIGWLGSLGGDEPASGTAQPTAVEQEKAATDAEADNPAAEEIAAQEAEDAAKAEAERVEAEQKAAEEAAAAEAKRVADEQAAAAAAAAEAAKGTVSQQNAYGSAQSYLEFKGFSRSGLIQQLSSEYGEGFPVADAEFAIARLEAEGGVDWNAEAAESAKSYLEFKSFSRQGLLDQLTSEYGEGFTPEQAEYGVSTTGL